MAESQVIRWDLVAPSTYAPKAPRRSLSRPDGSVTWRELLNLRAHDGVLKKRESIGEWQFQKPTLNSYTTRQEPRLIEEVPGDDGGRSRILVVTSLELHLYDSGADTWNNLTPIYNTGTVSVGSGGTTVTGAGTAWSDRCIAVGQIIELPTGSGDWYQIAAVVSNTQITIDRGHSGGLAGASYTIRRLFNAGPNGLEVSSTLPFFTSYLLGDCYLAGPVSNHKIGSNAWRDGGVLKIPRVADPRASPFGWSASDSAFLTSGENEVVPGLDYLGQQIDIMGMSLLPDGRIVLAVNWSNGIGGRARIYYSSHLNLAVWTSSPGGFTDIVGHNSKLNAMGFIGRNLTLHLDDGIEIGELTGQDDPPLNFFRSRASVGAVGPKAIVQVPGGEAIPRGELFIGPDATFYLFSGNDTAPVRTEEDVLEGIQYRYHQTARARLSPFRREACFLVGGDSTLPAQEMRLSWELGLVSKHTYESPVSIISGPINSGLADGSSPPNFAWEGRGRRNDSVAFLGVPGEVVGVATTDMVYRLRESGAADAVTAAPGGLSQDLAIRAVSDDIDFGLPDIEKTIERVAVWYSGEDTSSEELQVEVSPDSGATWEAAPRTKTLDGDNERIIYFFFTLAASEKWRFRLVGPDGASASFKYHIHRVRLYAVPTAESRAV